MGTYEKTQPLLIEFSDFLDCPICDCCTSCKLALAATFYMLGLAVVAEILDHGDKK